MHSMVDVFSTLWRIKNEPSNSTSCSDNVLCLLVLVACRLYWGLQVMFAFSVLKGCLERGIFWRAKSRLKSIEDFNLEHCSKLQPLQTNPCSLARPCGCGLHVRIIPFSLRVWSLSHNSFRLMRVPLEGRWVLNRYYFYDEPTPPKIWRNMQVVQGGDAWNVLLPFQMIVYVLNLGEIEARWALIE